MDKASAKEQAIQTIRRLPGDATMEDIVGALAFRMHVDAGLRELDEGKGIPHEEARKRLKQLRRHA